VAEYEIQVTLAPGVQFSIHSTTVSQLLDECKSLERNRDWIASEVAGLATAPSSQDYTTTAGQNMTLVDVDEPVKPQERIDPWSGQPVPEPVRKPSAARTEPSGGSSGAGRPAASGTPVKDTDRFGNLWTMGLPDAPSCEHGEAAALVKGKSQKGKQYTAWKCARGAPNGDWQTKCEFFEYPN
jgi:hypothetical protein